MPPPKISVCLDVYNYAEFLPRALESVLGQTFTDFELIVADDCSTDGSFEIAKTYADARIRLIRNSENLGMVRNRNVALRAARGDFIKPLHADDFLCAPDALAKMHALMESNAALSLVASAMCFVEADGRKSGAWSCFDPKRLRAGTSVITRCLREQRNLIGGPSAVLFRRARAGRGFDEKFFHMADLEMWFHLLEQGCFGFLAEPLCAYRKHPRQQTELDRGTLSQADDHEALLDRYLDSSYVMLKPWQKRHLRRDAQIQRARRCQELGVSFSPPALRTRIAVSVTNYALRQVRFIARHFRGTTKSSESFPPGLNVAGFFTGEYGIGESSRAFCRAVKESGVPYVLLNIRSKLHRNEDRSVQSYARNNPYRVNLMTFSYDYARRFYRDKGRRFFAGHYNIALWYCELEKFPPRWHSCFDYYDEIWVTTEFCHKAIAAVAPVPVVKIPPPILVETATPNRAKFGLSETACIFMFSFDHFSVFERKNPAGVIKAFKLAFSKGEDVTLVIKSINSANDPQGRETLHLAAAGYHVVFFEDHWPGSDVNILLASVDCYVSLHRAEGLGLGMAQAMSLGKPVIATGYSGNLEFMNPENSLLVNYNLVEIENDVGPYEKGYFWAEPDLEHAAELMRKVFQDRCFAHDLGAKSSRDIAEKMNPALAGQHIQKRIKAICSSVLQA